MDAGEQRAQIAPLPGTHAPLNFSVLPRRQLDAVGGAPIRELGDVTIKIGNVGHRVQVAHHPSDMALSIHGAMILLDDLDPALARGFTTISQRLMETLGTEEQAVQAELLAALVERVCRRHAFVRDGLARQIARARN